MGRSFLQREFPEAFLLAGPGDSFARFGIFHIKTDFLTQFPQVPKSFNLLAGPEKFMVYPAHVCKQKTSRASDFENPHIATRSFRQLGMNVKADLG